jgi:hypothetical protein
MCEVSDNEIREVLERLTRIETKLEMASDHETRVRQIEKSVQATDQTVQALKRFLWVIGGTLIAVVVDLIVSVIK